MLVLKKLLVWKFLHKGKFRVFLDFAFIAKITLCGNYTIKKYEGKLEKKLQYHL